MARTMSRSSGQRTSRSTSGSWTPTLSGPVGTRRGQLASAGRERRPRIARRWSGRAAAARRRRSWRRPRASRAPEVGHRRRVGPVDRAHVDELGHPGVRLGDEDDVRVGGVHPRDDRDAARRGRCRSCRRPRRRPTRRAPRPPAPAMTPIIVWPRVSKVIVAMRAMPGRRLADALDGGLDLVEVGHRLDPDEVHAAGDERGRLLAEDVDRDLVVERAERRDDLAARADVAGDEGACRRRRRTSARSEDRGGPVELVDAVREAVQARAAAGCHRTCWS